MPVPVPVLALALALALALVQMPGHPSSMSRPPPPTPIRLRLAAAPALPIRLEKEEQAPQLGQRKLRMKDEEGQEAVSDTAPRPLSLLSLSRPMGLWEALAAAAAEATAEAGAGEVGTAAAQAGRRGRGCSAFGTERWRNSTPPATISTARRQRVSFPPRASMLLLRPRWLGPRVRSRKPNTA